MTLKHDFQALLSHGRIIPQILWDILSDLDSRGEVSFNEAVMVVPVSVSAGDSTGSNGSPQLVGAVPMGIVPFGNQDQFVDNVEVEEDGTVRVTLAAPATAQNQFAVSVLIPSTP